MNNDTIQQGKCLCSHGHGGGAVVEQMHGDDPLQYFEKASWKIQQCYCAERDSEFEKMSSISKLVPRDPA